MRRIQPYFIMVLALLLTAFIAGCESREGGVEASGDGTETQGAVWTQADRQATMDLSRAHIHERFVAREAAQRASSEEVRDFAEMLVDDHTEALDELTEIMTEAGIASVEERSAEADRQMQDLQALSGAAFDRRFVEVMVQNHEESVEKLRQLETTAETEELREYVGDLLPTIEGHLDEAQELQSGLISGEGAETSE
jgi:putative membrane protein